MVQLNRRFLLIGIFSLVLSQANAEVMFEGYWQIKSGQTPIGFAVQRVEFNAAKKEFTSTAFVKTNAAGNNVTESTKAVANEKFQPINFQYTTKVGDALKIIDAKVSKDIMTATVSDGKNVQNLKVPIKKGTFLATFLQYLMLQQGYKVDKNFAYSAIAEEDAAVYNGEASIKSEEDYKGQKVFRILNTFKGSQFVSFVNPKGEVLGTSSPLQDISMELMASSADATKGMVLPTDTLKTLFGSVPLGKVNSLATKVSSAVPDSTPIAEVPLKSTPASPNLPADGAEPVPTFKVPPGTVPPMPTPTMKLHQPKKKGP